MSVITLVCRGIPISGTRSGMQEMAFKAVFVNGQEGQSSRPAYAIRTCFFFLCRKASGSVTVLVLQLQSTAEHIEKVESSVRDQIFRGKIPPHLQPKTLQKWKRFTFAAWNLRDSPQHPERGTL